MRALKVIGRVLYLLLCAATVIAGINIFALDASYIIIAYIAVHSVCYLLSLPLVIGVGASVRKRRKRSGALPYVIAAVLSLYIVAPVTLVIMFVRQFVALVRGIGGREPVKAEYSVEERREIYHTSAALALESILDPTTARDIVLDDGVSTMTLKQVGTVNCLGRRFALLAPPVHEDEEPYTYVYEIRPREGKDSALTLIPVVDNKTYLAVFEAYKTLMTL